MNTRRSVVDALDSFSKQSPRATWTVSPLRGFKRASLSAAYCSIYHATHTAQTCWTRCDCSENSIGLKNSSRLGGDENVGLGWLDVLELKAYNATGERHRHCTLSSSRPKWSKAQTEFFVVGLPRLGELRSLEIKTGTKWTHLYYTLGNSPLLRPLVAGS